MKKIISLDCSVFRVHEPKWAFMPASGAGAGRHGGRLNRIGVDALYLSLEAATALAEYQQLDRLLLPGLMVSYQIKVDQIVDFSGGYDSGCDPVWQDFYCDWREQYFNQGIEPASWLIGDTILDAGYKGILFRSSLPGVDGKNIVLYTDQLAPTDILIAHDPYGALPKNQDSWS